MKRGELLISEPSSTSFFKIISSRNMIGGRQLPSWMLKSNATNEASVSKSKEEDSGAVNDRTCKRQEKVLTKKKATAVPVLENKSHLLKKCEGKRKRRLIKQVEDPLAEGDENGPEVKVNIKAGKGFQEGDEEHLFDKCETSKRKRMSNKHSHGQGGDSNGSETEIKVDIASRKRNQCNAPRRKKQKEKNLMEGSHDGITELIGSDDEITVEDLISIAEECVHTEKEKELQNVGMHSETSTTGSEKIFTANVENKVSITEKPQSTTSSVTRPLPSGGSMTKPINTGDPARDMLDLFLGPLLKTSEEVGRTVDVMTEKLMLDHEVSRRSQNDIVVHVASATKKKSSLKDKVSMLLD